MSDIIMSIGSIPAVIGNIGAEETVIGNTSGAAFLGKGDKGDRGEPGQDGVDGTTFTPSVDADGNLSWTNDDGKPNPQTVNIKGSQGVQGVPGRDGVDGHTPAITASKSGKTTTIYADGVAIATIVDGDDGSGAVISINGKDGNVVLDAEDVGALPDTTVIPSKTSDLTNDSGFLTEHQSLVGYATETYVDNHHDSTKEDVISDLATIRSGAALGATAVQPEAGKGLFSGNYNDLANKPTIPEAVTETTVSGWGFTKNTGTYVKPSGGIPASDIAANAVTREKLATDALYSPVVMLSGNVNLDSSHLGKTLIGKYSSSSATRTITLTQAISTSLPVGFEVAVCRPFNYSEVNISFSGLRLIYDGTFMSTAANRTASLPELGTMIALKKIETHNTNGDLWMITGNVEVV